MAMSGLQAREGVVGVLLIIDLDLVGGSQAEFLSLNLGLENTFGALVENCHNHLLQNNPIFLS